MCFELKENRRYFQTQLEKFNRYLMTWQKSLEEYLSGFIGFRRIKTAVEKYNAGNSEPYFNFRGISLAYKIHVKIVLKSKVLTAFKSVDVASVKINL